MRRRRGVALVLTLLVLALVVVIVTQLRYVVGVDARLAKNQLSETKNFAAVYGGVELAKTYLAADLLETPTGGAGGTGGTGGAGGTGGTGGAGGTGGTGGSTGGSTGADTYRDIWADPEETNTPIGDLPEELQIELTISSEEGKINLNGLLREDRRELTETLIQQIVATIGWEETIAQAIIDRVDERAGDDQVPLATIYDLINEDITWAMVDGDSLAMSEEETLPTGEIFGLREVFTVLSTGDININLMPKPVFSAVAFVLPDTVKTGTEAAQLVEKYLEYVGEPGGEGEDMTEVAHLGNVEGFDQAKLQKYLEATTGDGPAAALRPMLVVKSTTFLAEIRAAIDGIEKTVEAYIRRDEETGISTLLFWKEVETPPVAR